MVSNIYEDLLKEIGHELEIELAPDQNDSCQIRLAEGVQLQMEIYKRTNQFVLCFRLGNPPPGKYRETLLKEALRANGLPAPRHGTFGFSASTEALYLFELLNLDRLDGKKIVEHMMAMKDTAIAWTEAISNGNIPQVASSTSFGGGGMGLFGIRG